MLGTEAFSADVLGHILSLWTNIAVMVGFGTVMILLAVWSFSN